MNLNDLKKEAYQCAVEHGWHDTDLSDEHCLCLVISELMEALEADRTRRHADQAQFKFYMDQKERSVDEFIYAFEHGIKDSVEDELADVCIRLFDFSGMRGIILVNPIYLYTNDECITFTEFCYKICSQISNPGRTTFEKGLIINLVLNDIFNYCKIKGIPIMWHITEKMKYNKLRPYKHGGKSY